MRRPVELRHVCLPERIPHVYIEYFKVPTEHYGWLFGLNILLMMVVTFANSRLVKGWVPNACCDTA